MLRFILILSLVATAAGRLGHPMYHTGSSASLSGATHKVTCIQTTIDRSVVAREDIVTVCNGFLAATANATTNETTWNATIQACDRMMSSGASPVQLSLVALIAILVATRQSM